MPSFVEECMRGARDPADIDAAVDAWHQGRAGGGDLRSHLGLAVCEYEAWLRDPSSLDRLVAAHRAAAAIMADPAAGPDDPDLRLDGISVGETWLWHDGPLLYEGTDDEGRRWLVHCCDLLEIGEGDAAVDVERWLIVPTDAAAVEAVAAGASLADAFRAAGHAFHLDVSRLGWRKLGQRRVPMAEVPEDHFPIDPREAAP